MLRGVHTFLICLHNLMSEVVGITASPYLVSAILIRSVEFLALEQSETTRGVAVRGVDAAYFIWWENAYNQ